jgi:hypothetical protein
LAVQSGRQLGEGVWCLKPNWGLVMGVPSEIVAGGVERRWWGGVYEAVVVVAGD